MNLAKVQGELRSTNLRKDLNVGIWLSVRTKCVRAKHPVDEVYCKKESAHANLVQPERSSGRMLRPYKSRNSSLLYCVPHNHPPLRRSGDLYESLLLEHRRKPHKAGNRREALIFWKGGVGLNDGPALGADVFDGGLDCGAGDPLIPMLLGDEETNQRPHLGIIDRLKYRGAI